MQKKSEDRILDFICKFDTDLPEINIKVKFKHIKLLMNHLNNALLQETQFQYQHKHNSCKE